MPESTAVSRLPRWARLLAVAFVASSIVTANAVVDAKPAEAATVLSSYVSINSTTVTTGGSKASITVRYTVKKNIPSNVNISLAWKHASATRSNASNSAKTLSGQKKGTHTVTLTGVPKIRMIARVVLTLGRPYEEISRAVLIDSGAHTTSKAVTAAEAAANAVAAYVPGAVLTYAPQTRLVRLAGMAVLGWTIWSDVKVAIGIGSSGCPKLAKGQYIQTKTWLTTNGASAQLNGNIRVWKSQADYQRGKTPLCNVTNIKATWR